jgi:hypothetical protein
MKGEPIYALRRRGSSKRAIRMSQMLNIALSALLIAMVGLMPAKAAFADQTLELPQTAVPVETALADAPIAEKARPEALSPIPANLGSIDDYENQDGSSYAANTSTSSPLPVERRGNQTALRNEVLAGALILGVLALEFGGSHHHR